MKNKNKGFTLVEVVISITLLAIIGITIGISLNKTNKVKSNDDYKTYVDKVKSSANVYLSANEKTESELETNKGYILIYVSDIVKAGLIDSNLTNPKTNIKISESKDKIKVSLDENGTIKFTYPATNSDSYLSAKNIIFKKSDTPNGSVDCFTGIDTLNLGYIDEKGNLVENYFTNSKNGDNYTKLECVTDVSKIDTNKIGNYKIKYKYLTTTGTWKSATRMVNVVDGIPPVIENVKLNPAGPSWTTSNVTLTSDISDNSGLAGYCIISYSNQSAFPQTSNCSCPTFIKKDASNNNLTGKKQASTKNILTKTNYYYICASDTMGNTAHSDELDVHYVDTTKPSVTLTVSPSNDSTNFVVGSTAYSTKYDIIASLVDNDSGLAAYAISSNCSSTPSNWQTISDYPKTYQTTISALNNGNYAVWAKDQVGLTNCSMKNINSVVTAKSINPNASNVELSDTTVSDNQYITGAVKVIDYSASVGSINYAYIENSRIYYNGTVISTAKTGLKDVSVTADSTSASTECSERDCPYGGYQNGDVCTGEDYTFENSTCYCHFVTHSPWGVSCSSGWGGLCDEELSCKDGYSRLDENGNEQANYHTTTNNGSSYNNSNINCLCEELTGLSSLQTYLGNLKSQGTETYDRPILATGYCRWERDYDSCQNYTTTCPNGYDYNPSYDRCYRCNSGNLSGSSCVSQVEYTYYLSSYNYTINYWVVK